VKPETIDTHALERFLLASGVEESRAQALLAELSWALSSRTTSAEIESLLGMRLSLAEAVQDMREESHATGKTLGLALRLFRHDAEAYQRAYARGLRRTIHLLLAILAVQLLLMGILAFALPLGEPAGGTAHAVAGWLCPSTQPVTENRTVAQ